MTLKVTPQVLHEAAGDCTTTAAEIHDDLADLKSYVLFLVGEWRGVASTSFNELMLDFDRCGKSLEEALTGIGSGLTQNAVNYVDNESGVNKDIVNVHHSIPPARI